MGNRGRNVQNELAQRGRWASHLASPIDAPGEGAGSGHAGAAAMAGRVHRALPAATVERPGRELAGTAWAPSFPSPAERPMLARWTRSAAECAPTGSR